MLIHPNGCLLKDVQKIKLLQEVAASKSSGAFPALTDREQRAELWRLQAGRLGQEQFGETHRRQPKGAWLSGVAELLSCWELCASKISQTGHQ